MWKFLWVSLTIATDLSLVSTTPVNKNRNIKDMTCAKFSMDTRDHIVPEITSLADNFYTRALKAPASSLPLVSLTLVRDEKF
jgi:hypothetical protein